MKKAVYLDGKFSVHKVGQVDYVHEENTLHFPDGTTDSDAVWGLYSGKCQQIDGKIQALKSEQQSLEQAYENFLKTQQN